MYMLQYVKEERYFKFFVLGTWKERDIVSVY